MQGEQVTFDYLKPQLSSRTMTEIERAIGPSNLFPFSHLR